MKRLVKIGIAIAFCFMMLLTSSLVGAKEVIKSERFNKANGDGYVGVINLYDDHTIDFLYAYRVNNIRVQVCKVGECQPDEYQIEPHRSYLDGQEAIFYLDDYLEDKTTYKIKASANFGLNSSNDSSVTITFEYELKIDDSEDEDDSEKFFQSLEGFKDVMNKWVIPLIYMTLGVTFVVKGILLSIDIVKYSNAPDVRKVKLQGFLYLSIALLLIAILNTIVGIITGLFNRF